MMKLTLTNNKKHTQTQSICLFSFFLIFVFQILLLLRLLFDDSQLVKILIVLLFATAGAFHNFLVLKFFPLKGSLQKFPLSVLLIFLFIKSSHIFTADVYIFSTFCNDLFVPQELQVLAFRFELRERLAQSADFSILIVLLKFLLLYDLLDVFGLHLFFPSARIQLIDYNLLYFGCYATF